MEQIQQQLMACLSAYAAGQEQARRIPGEMDWTGLYHLAQCHKLTPIVFETLWQQEGFCDTEPALCGRWKMETLLQTAGQTARTSKVLEISALLEQEKLPHAVVKGIVCRDLYSRPDLRLSGDEDLLIHRRDAGRCGALLGRLGFQRQAREGENVTHWLEPVSGLHVELHTGLLESSRPQARKLNDRLMEGLSRAIVLSAGGGSVRTLPHTEHFVFLVCHALQHFVAGGVGVRTLCDMARFAQVYEAQIDWEKVTELLGPVRALNFLDQVFELGRTWWGLSAGLRFSEDPIDPGQLLQDSLDAGVYGQSTASRQHSAAVVAQAAEGEKGLYRVLFPQAKAMKHRYPVLQRWPVLLPACWLHRLGRYGLQVLRGNRADNSPAQSLELGRERMEMMKKYGIFPRDL